MITHTRRLVTHRNAAHAHLCVIRHTFARDLCGRAPKPANGWQRAHQQTVCAACRRIYRRLFAKNH